MKLAVGFLLLFVVAVPSVVHSKFFKGACCRVLVPAVWKLKAEVKALQNAPDYNETIEDLQSQVSSLQNQTDSQQASLDTLTSECDCQSFTQRLDALNASLTALQDMVEMLMMDMPMNGSLRLINDVDDQMDRGRLEIFLFGSWGTICQDFWSKNDAIVACNQLGLPSGDPVALKGTQDPMSPYGQGSGPIWLDNIICDGSESSLLDCPTNGDGPGMTNCNHSEDVGLICQD